MAKVKLGTNLPEHLIGTDPGALKEFLSAIEQLGYGYVTVGDHVLGAETSVRPDWKPFFGHPPLYDRHMVWHEPLVLFGYLSAITETLELCTGILIAPQRQTVLLAKQAAEADVLSGGRIRFVIAAGWNDVEYEALGIDFRKRGKIMEEQFVLMRELWSKEVVNYNGHHHTVSHAGINPLPTNKRVPLWVGGQSKVVLKRTGRLGDGWFPYYPWFSEDLLHQDWEIIQDAAKGAGRDPSEVGLEGARAASFAQWRDVDADGRLDLLLGTRRGPLRLFRNVEGRSFEDVSFAAGLDHVHAQGLLHCDLKPHNVLFADDGRPLLSGQCRERAACIGEQGLAAGGRCRLAKPTRHSGQPDSEPQNNQSGRQTARGPALVKRKRGLPDLSSVPEAVLLPLAASRQA